MEQQTYHIVIAVIRDHESILMVEQQGVDDPQPYWVLPGGLVEPGELLAEALTREVQEETGLLLDDIGRLAYCTQIDHPQRNAQTIAFAFEVQAWSGTLASQDPDGEILQVVWVPLAEANQRLGHITWLGMREPLLAYLGGDRPAGAMWLYREDQGEQQYITCLTMSDTLLTSVRQGNPREFDIHILRNWSMPVGVTLRPWKPADFPAIQSLSAIEGWPTPSERAEASLTSWQHAWPAIIAEADGQIIGFLRALSDGAVSTYVAELLVVPAWRGYGLGRALLDACQALVPSTRLDLLAEPTATDFYTHCGFRSFAGFRRSRIT